MRAEVAGRSRASFGLGAACAALALVCAASGAALAAAAKQPSHAAGLSAEQIVAKNAAARGGLEAWRKVETMVWSGHLESAHTPAPSLPFELEQKRPNKTRFEIHVQNQRTLRMFDGARGWKSKPSPSGRMDIVPYTPDEERYARDEPVIDGALIDYDAKGSAVSLAGAEELGGRKAYHLAVRLASGQRQDVWVDAESFLEVKIGRMTNGAGGPRMVPTFYRDYQTFEGLSIPTTIQIGDNSMGMPDLMHIERVTLNAPLSERRFSPPGASPRQRSAPPSASTDPAPAPAPVPR
jgi:hypothetical protein